MNCNCKGEVEALFQERLKASVPAGANHQARLHGYGIVLVSSGMEYRPYFEVQMSVEVPKKAGGTTVKKSRSNMFFSYCPFCGKPVNETKESTCQTTAA